MTTAASVAGGRAGAAGGARTASPAERFIARWRPELEGALAAALHRDEPPLSALHHAARAAAGVDEAAGHRWRPLLTLAVVEAFGRDPRVGLDAACAVELTHTASLVLDDLPSMDNSPLRRGRESAHVRVGEAGAILVAVGLLGRAVELLAAGPHAGRGGCADWGRMLGLAGMAGGQAVDLTTSGRLLGATRRAHRRKTTALAAFAFGIGARVAGAPPVARQALERVGAHLGWAYQIADDADDVHLDRRAGRPEAHRRALHAIGRLGERADRAVRDCPGLTRSGRILLGDFGARLLALLSQGVARSC